MRLEPRLDVVLNLGPQRAAFDRELHPDGDDAVGGDLDVGGHAQVDDVGPEFGVDHGAKQIADLLHRGWLDGSPADGAVRGVCGGHALNLSLRVAAVCRRLQLCLSR